MKNHNILYSLSKNTTTNSSYGLFCYNKTLEPLLSKNHYTMATSYKSSISVNPDKEYDHIYNDLICKNCLREVPNKTFLETNGCLWCIQKKDLL